MNTLFKEERALLRSLIKRLKELEESDSVEENIDEFYDIERRVQDMEAEMGGICDMRGGDTLDDLIERAKKVIKSIKGNYDLYDEDAEWDNMFPNREDDDSDLFTFL